MALIYPRKHWQIYFWPGQELWPLNEQYPLAPVTPQDKVKNREVWSYWANRIRVWGPSSLSQGLRVCFLTDEPLIMCWTPDKTVYLSISTKRAKGRFSLRGKHFSCNIISILVKRYPHIQQMGQAMLFCELSLYSCKFQILKDFALRAKMSCTLASW